MGVFPPQKFSLLLLLNCIFFFFEAQRNNLGHHSFFSTACCSVIYNHGNILKTGAEAKSKKYNLPLNNSNPILLESSHFY